MQFDDVESFESHLKSRTGDISGIISSLQSKAANAPPEVSDLQSQLASKLAEEKVAVSELEKAVAEKQQLEERLEDASLRYMVAEKKLDRARSLTAVKLEKQYLLGAQRPGGDSASVKREEPSTPNNVASKGERNEELEEAHHKTLAVSEKQKDQLRQLETDNAELTSQLTEIKIKASIFLHNEKGSRLTVLLVL